MKSKNKKAKPTTPRNSEEDLSLPSTKSSAFTFLKNRFFQQQQQQQQLNEQFTGSSSSNGSSPRLSTSSTRSNITATTITKPWNIENNTIIDKPTSRSFDEHSIHEVKSLLKNNRPVSMMGLEMLQSSVEEEENASTALVIPRIKTTINKKENRTSLIIIKEGYLYKKTDFKPFHKQTKLDRGWKLYKVILRGHKLYLYKLTTESPLKSLFPSQQSLLSNSASQHSLTLNHNHSNLGLTLNQSEFDIESQNILFNVNTNTRGLICTNQSNLQQCYLIISTHDGQLYTCNRSNNLWKIDLKVSMSALKIEQQKQQDSHSNGSLLFNILYINRPATSALLGIYSTIQRDVGLNWIQLFNSYSKEDVTSRSSSNNSIAVIEEDECWDNANSNTTTENSNSRMYDATQRYHPDLIFTHSDRSDDTNQIQGGTINAFIHELLFNDDNHILNVFLLNYSNFTTGTQILNQFKFILTKNPKVEQRLFDIFVIWCKEFSLDIMGDIVSNMMNILDYENIVDKKRAKQIKELVLKTVTRNGKKNCDGEDLIITAEKSNELLSSGIEEEKNDHVENISAFEAVEGKRRDSINLSNLLITGLTFDLFLTIDPTSFAKQIYLFHFKKHQQFNQDLLNPLSYLQKPQISIQMLNSLLFTTVSPHFLTKLIRNQILIETQHDVVENAMLIRSKLLEHWIKIGIHLLELGDMTGWTAIAMGVCSVGIVRLRETWKAVDRQLVDIVQLDWVNVLSNYGLFNQNLWADGWEHQSKFSKVLAIHNVQFRNINTATVATSLPFFGTIRQSVDRLKRHVRLLIGPNIINFVECERIYNTIVSSLEDYKKHQHTYVMMDDVFSVGPLQSFFEHSVTDLMSVPHDFKYLQECSLACEPRIFGQGFDRRKFSKSTTVPIKNQAGIDVAPPSTSSLVFPSILDSCSLLDVEHGKSLYIK